MLQSKLWAERRGVSLLPALSAHVPWRPGPRRRGLQRVFYNNPPASAGWL